MIVSASGASAADAERLADVAEKALAQGREAEAIGPVRDGATRLQSPLLWQWTALLQRSLDENEEALSSFANAARLDPNNARIAHGRAHTALEAGLPAVDLFLGARRLDERNGEIVIGLAAARVAAGEGERAVAELRELLTQNPLWLQGHAHLGQILAVLGRRDEATSSLEQALKAAPRAVQLWQTYFNLLLGSGNYRSLRPLIERAAGAGVRPADLAFYEAVDQAEHDPSDFPPALFAEAPPELESVLDSWRVRHLLRVGEAEAALPILERGLRGPASAELWPYAATVWRITGDPKSHWLEGEQNLVQVMDLSNRIADVERLAEVLRGLHVSRAEYLDQSVRGGTQTDGPLFARMEPEIRQLRAAVVEAVDKYRKRLPAHEPGHPLLSQPRDKRIRFSGSWSVRLRSGGKHSNHVHPQGWISSALYVALPDERAGHEGWLQLGAPDEKLGLRLEPTQLVEPKVAHVVLFPSWMWHGTMPFTGKERLTVAFDVAMPR